MSVRAIQVAQEADHRAMIVVVESVVEIYGFIESMGDKMGEAQEVGVQVFLNTVSEYAESIITKLNGLLSNIKANFSTIGTLRSAISAVREQPGHSTNNKISLDKKYLLVEAMANRSIASARVFMGLIREWNEFKTLIDSYTPTSDDTLTPEERTQFAEQLKEIRTLEETLDLVSWDSPDLTTASASLDNLRRIVEKREAIKNSVRPPYYKIMTTGFYLHMKTYLETIKLLHRMQVKDVETDVVSCAVCHKPTGSLCAGCQERPICSRACQVVDWPTHKAECKRIRAAKSAAAGAGTARKSRRARKTRKGKNSRK